MGVCARAVVAAGLAVGASLGCGDPVPGRVLPPGARMAEGGAPQQALRFDPPAEVSAVASITRVLLDLPEPFGGGRVLLLRGALTSLQLRDLARPVLTQALHARVVPATVWVGPTPSVITLAPVVSLTPGELYTVGVSAPAQAWPFIVASSSTRRTVARIWPDAPTAHARSVVWCDSELAGAFTTTPFEPMPHALQPAGMEGAFERGTGASAVPAGCLTWRASLASPELEIDGLPAVTPPTLAVAGADEVALEPATLVAGAYAPVVARHCASEEIAFASGCGVVEDDRVVVRAPDHPLLWTISGAGPPLLRSTQGGERFVVRPLPPSQLLEVTTLDAAARVVTTAVPVPPGRARAHVVINEVMANPRGPEPAQEWVELYNDGSSTVDLDGYTLEDAQRAVVLPACELAAGAFALIVSKTFTPRPQDDRVPPTSARLVPVDVLALANDGERLSLRDPAGVVVSTFPAIKSTNGVSVCRTSPDAGDEEPSAFRASTAPDGSSPGSAN